jgi:hypothetical protein
MTTTKRKLSLTLDEELLVFLERNSEALSFQVNEALRNEVGRQRGQEALGALLDRLSCDDGPLDTATDEAEIARYMRLLGGPA